MQHKIDYAMRQALDARAAADASMDNHMREQWLMVARMWDELVKACDGVRREQELALTAS